MTDDLVRTTRTGGSGRGRGALLGGSGAPSLPGAALVLVLAVAALRPPIRRFAQRPARMPTP